MPRTIVIAEAGVNHNGSMELARRLVDIAVEARADVVKFQTWKTGNVVTKETPLLDYQRESIRAGQSLFGLLQRLELPYESFRTLKDYCDRRGIEFLSTADEAESATFLSTLQQRFKTGSAELTDTPFLRHIARFRKPVIVSTGMASLEEVARAVSTLTEEGLERSQITLLHCTSSYPTAPRDVNLLAMVTMRDAFKVQVGLSDHTIGIEIPVAAVALGAAVMEKHFTFDKAAKGPDHSMSLDPRQLGDMVDAIRNTELALGSGIKEPTSLELAERAAMRKAIVAKVPIARGELLTAQNVSAKRPGTGLPPALLDYVVGRRAGKDYRRDDPIEL